MDQHVNCQDSVSMEQLSTAEFLKLVGKRIRVRRNTEKMSRKTLAQLSGVSERYLAQLETGQGNMSIALLRNVSAAVGLPLSDLLADDTAPAGWG